MARNTSKAKGANCGDKKSIFKKIAEFIGLRHTQQDVINLNLYGLNITISRKLDIDVPHEVTVVVPRVEIREKIADKNNPQREREIIFNSITVVHAPRHSSAQNSPSDIHR
ncbi:hypothetical protein [Caldanaerobius polysaccharolyticus]|uniref:hypothetical protein n=1 Tax=Caldanaerobius polysaccharolyticus TaxID=44256 RepID=UPI000690A01D|nr:hypothetical protein [Caldanaerobius polysaccharolyticus]